MITQYGDFVEVSPEDAHNPFLMGHVASVLQKECVPEGSNIVKTEITCKKMDDIWVIRILCDVEE